METRKLKDGSLRYRESVLIGNHRIRSPFFNKKTDARDWKANKLNERNKLLVLGEAYKPQCKLSFNEFSSNWLQTKIKHLKSPSTYQDYERILRVHLCPIIGNFTLSNIRLKEADHLVSKLREKGTSPKGIQDILTVLKQILNEAETREEISKNHLRRYKGPKVPQQDFKYWSGNEINRFLLACKDHPYYGFFVTALYTGMRKGEIAALTWECIDFQRNLITVKGTLDKFGHRLSTKSGKIRWVPMNDFLKSTLITLFRSRKEDSKYVFLLKNKPIDTNHLYRVFKVIQEKAQIGTKLRVHDLRHTFASNFMMKGLGSLYDLSQILGHADTKMTQRYAHLSPQHLALATQNLKYGVENELSEKVAPFQPLDDFNSLMEEIRMMKC